MIAAHIGGPAVLHAHAIDDHMDMRMRLVIVADDQRLAILNTERF
jgi:hypothetical protein